MQLESVYTYLVAEITKSETEVFQIVLLIQLDSMCPVIHLQY